MGKLWIRQWSLSIVSQRSSSAQHLWMEFEGSQHSPCVVFLWSWQFPASLTRVWRSQHRPPGTSPCFFKFPLTRNIFFGVGAPKASTAGLSHFLGDLSSFFLTEFPLSKPSLRLSSPASVSPRNLAWISQSSRAEMLFSLLYTLIAVIA